jgi:hypothetical protein
MHAHCRRCGSWRMGSKPSRDRLARKVWAASLALAMTAERRIRDAAARACDACAPCANCPSCQSAAWRRALPCRANQPHHPPRSAAARGTFRDRHERWQQDAMDAMRRQTSDVIAYGEVVWSWRPKAGVTPCEMMQGNGDNNAWSPGRSRISRNTIAQGRPDVTARPVVPAPCIIFARGPWVLAKHPAFPAPSRFRGHVRWHHSGTGCRENAQACHHDSSCPASSGASSTPWLLDSSTAPLEYRIARTSRR